MKIIRRRRPGDDPDTPLPQAQPLQWVKIENYPNLELERIRGVDVYRTTGSPTRFRIVFSIVIDRCYRVPSIIAIENERRIRFGESPVEFGFIPPGERKVGTWLRNLPAYRNKDVVLSNPDFVELSTTTLAELASTNSTTDDS